MQTATYVMWCREQLWNAGALKGVRRSGVVIIIAVIVVVEDVKLFLLVTPVLCGL